MSNATKTQGFTVIEVMIAVLIFGIGLLAAYLLVNTANSLSLRSKQEIIATNLLREQIELIKNMRDTNFLALRKFDSIKAADANCGTNCTLSPGTWYTVRNQYILGAPISLSELRGVPPTEKERKLWVGKESQKAFSDTQFRYCQDDLGRYRLDCSFPGVKPTPYYGFFQIEEVSAENLSIPVPGALKITAYFISTEAGYRELKMATLITDFKE